MNTIELVKEGKEYNLIYNPIQKTRIFIPKNWDIIFDEDVDPIPYSKKNIKYTAFKVEGGNKIFHGDKIPEKGYLFKIKKYRKYKGHEYPVADNYEVVYPETMEPVASFEVNRLWDSSPDFLLPDYDDCVLEKAKEKNGGNIYSVNGWYYAFTEESAKSFAEVYNHIIKELHENMEAWKSYKMKGVGPIYGLTVEDVVKNPNGTADYRVGGGRVHEYHIDDFPAEKPPLAEKVRFDDFGQPEFLKQGVWYDYLEDLEEVDF